METVFCRFLHGKQCCILGIQPAPVENWALRKFQCVQYTKWFWVGIRNYADDTINDWASISSQVLRNIFTYYIRMRKTLIFGLHYTEFWLLKVIFEPNTYDLFYFIGQCYVNSKGLITVSSMFGYNERPLFLLRSEATQSLQVYKLLDFKWHERKPFGPEVDMSFCSP